MVSLPGAFEWPKVSYEATRRRKSPSRRKNQSHLRVHSIACLRRKAGKLYRAVRILFVCTGNICRSPTAEGVFRKLLLKDSLEDKIRADSAGTHDYHVGQPPDRRSTEHALRRGYDLSGLRARQITTGNFSEFDLLLAMDRGHLEILRRLSPPAHRHKLKLFLEFAGQAHADVPDPYYGGSDGFKQVLDMVEAASRGLLDHLRVHLLRVST